MSAVSIAERLSAGMRQSWQSTQFHGRPLNAGIFKFLRTCAGKAHMNLIAKGHSVSKEI
ncbi:MAG: hypothetical protein KIT42_06210 [Rhodocyclaceae bacterium]|nr:hypothetical protein [Rhodocyclaceae bacterium]